MGRTDNGCSNKSSEEAAMAGRTGLDPMMRELVRTGRRKADRRNTCYVIHSFACSRGGRTRLARDWSKVYQDTEDRSAEYIAKELEANEAEKHLKFFFFKISKLFVVPVAKNCYAN